MSKPAKEKLAPAGAKKQMEPEDYEALYGPELGPYAYDLSYLDPEKRKKLDLLRYGREERIQANLDRYREADRAHLRAALQIVLRHAIAWLQRNPQHLQARLVAAHVARIAPHWLHSAVRPMKPSTPV